MSAVSVWPALFLLAFSGVPLFRRAVVVQIQNSHGQNTDSPVDPFHPAVRDILHITAIGTWGDRESFRSFQGCFTSCRSESDGHLQLSCPPVSTEWALFYSDLQVTLGSTRSDLGTVTLMKYAPKGGGFCCVVLKYYASTAFFSFL